MLIGVIDVIGIGCLELRTHFRIEYGVIKVLVPLTHQYLTCAPQLPLPAR